MKEKIKVKTLDVRDRSASEQKKLQKMLADGWEIQAEHPKTDWFGSPYGITYHLVKKG